jgi:hypothetical protein
MAKRTYVARHGMRIRGLDDHSNSDEGSNNHCGISALCANNFRREPRSRIAGETLCAEVAPCQLATDVIGPHQYVGVALGLQPAGTKPANDAVPTPEQEYFSVLQIEYVLPDCQEQRRRNKGDCRQPSGVWWQCADR